MNAKHDISIEDFEELMTDYLRKRGFSDDYIAGFLEAQRLSGWSRKNCPAWMRNSAALHFAIPPQHNFPGKPENSNEKPIELTP